MMSRVAQRPGVGRWGWRVGVENGEWELGDECGCC